MGIDYYGVLEINRNATIDDIKRSYRRLALKYHPEFNKTDLAIENFKQISEAYDVLSDLKKKSVYDQFGEEGLKNGVPESADPTGAWTQGYTFHGEPLKIFEDFFGVNNPFAEWFDRRDGELDMGFGGVNGRGQRQKDPPIERDLMVDLEDMYQGCIKKMKISRRVMNEDGHTSSIRDKILTVHVKPEWKEGTKVIFPKEGDQGPNNIPADIVFIIKDKKHPRFHRVGYDLIFTKEVQLGEALTGCKVDINTLDGRELNVPINEVVRPGFEKVILGEGMLMPAGRERPRGNLVIRFDIVFPTSLSEEKKILIRKSLL